MSFFISSSNLSKLKTLHDLVKYLTVFPTDLKAMSGGGVTARL